jgi:monofunctional biosynthetic peptidoglycan transglycosylase
MTDATGKIDGRQGNNLGARAMRLLRLAPYVLIVLFFVPYYLTGLYILVNPPVTALMVQKLLAGNGIAYRWRGLDAISPALVTQVIASEDGRFCSHRGVDWSALDAAADAFAEGRARGGGSTITMQTAKNLFLWTRPAFLRKPLEIPLAYYMDFVLGKRRLMEIYLNVVEWAPGVYGAEAAARHHFGKPAASLTAQEAAQLAAALPNPRRRNAGRPGPRVFALAERLKARASGERGAAWCVEGREMPQEQEESD